MQQLMNENLKVLLWRQAWVKEDAFRGRLKITVPAVLAESPQLFFNDGQRVAPHGSFLGHASMLHETSAKSLKLSGSWWNEYTCASEAHAERIEGANPSEPTNLPG